MATARRYCVGLAIERTGRGSITYKALPATTVLSVLASREAVEWGWESMSLNAARRDGAR